ncbi:YoaK family protein [Variovorax sp. J22R133]|uniref:YoaK family protein n=1 Tax=Variovorax brevis TaxID=3053503 RepID=UPI002576109E|nr:YoaK family protein [Variovorax sp. J22R133]MDM0112312.1 YoaK family protein [Variovorax sp. J22R133]
MSRTLVTGSALGFTAGYVDTVGFVALFGLFTAHVTGNFVLIGSEMAQPTESVLIKLLAFAAFIAAVAASRLLALSVERRGGPVHRLLLLLQGALLAACMLCGWRAQPIVDAGAPWVLATGVLGAAAMGVQNAAARLVYSDLAPTTVMTGNATQLVLDLVELLRRDTTDTGLRQRIRKLIWPLIAFACGALCGAFACMRASMWALALPLAILFGLALTPSAQR